MASEYGAVPQPVIEASRNLDAEAVAELWHMLKTEERVGWSANDFAQAVDDWFVGHGFPTILYGA